MSLAVRDSTYSGIDLQFPALYREDGEFMVEFTKAYYKFLDERMDRNIPKLRDIDTTLTSFLIFFKKKYLADLPLDTVIDTRFIIKHVTDLYRRKGTQESLELLFQLFYNEQIEVSYPATNILKPSDSVWGGDTYLEMNTVFVVDNYPIQKGDRIKGDISLASGFVDEIIFVNFTGSLTPLIYLSNIVGKFSSDDGLLVTRLGVTTIVGKLIAGSISESTVSPGSRIPGQVVGNRLKLASDIYGINATASVLSVSDTTTGQIEFNIEEGGFGYVNPSSVTATNAVGVSNQVLIVTQTSSPTIKSGDIISCDEAAITSPTKTFLSTPTPISGTGVVISYVHPLIYIKTMTDDAFNLFPVNPLDTTNETITDSVATFKINGSEAGTLTTVGNFNSSASFEVAGIDNNEYVTLITDQIGDYEDILLSDSDYGMTGAGQESLTTTLTDAFTPLTVEIGTISELKILSSGTNYENDVYSKIEHSNISKFDKKDIIINFSDTNFLLKAGDVITQVRQIEDLAAASQVGNVDAEGLSVSNATGSYPSTTTISVSSGSTIPYTVKAKLIRREGNDYYFRQLSFYDFVEDASVNISNNLYAISNIRYDVNSLPMGANATISGRASYETGQIKSIAIVNSGYRYQDSEIVSVVNNEPTSPYYNQVVANATVRTLGAGATEGTWKTTTSFLSDVTKKIHDNYYYQEYSYEVSSIVDPAKYEPLIKDTIGVAGTKIFSAPLINSINNVAPTIDIELQVYDISEENVLTENGIDAILSEDSADNIVATIVTLDVDTTASIKTSIGI